jgi:hypothetical protein
MNISQKLFKPSRSFLITLGVLLIIGVAEKPIIKLARAQYDVYKGSTTILVASEKEYQGLLTTIKTQQPNQTLSKSVTAEFPISEKIFQTAISPELLGRSSKYEPYTSNGQLACAWMVNMVVQKAFNYRIGQNPLYVPSVVEALDNGVGHRIEQSQTKRGDLAIANGTDYEKGLWHIGICANDRCTLVLSNSPSTSRFDWLSDPNFQGAFDQYPGKTTFYRVTKIGL